MCATELYFGPIFNNNKIISLYETNFKHSQIYERSKNLEKDLWSQQNCIKYIHERRKSQLLRKHIMNKEFSRVPFLSVGTIVKKMNRSNKNLQHTARDLYTVNSIVRQHARHVITPGTDVPAADNCHPLTCS